MKNSLLGLSAAVAAVLALGVVHAQSKGSSPAPEESQYQIISATVDGTASVPNIEPPPEHVVFILDTKTGRVWKYEAGIQAFRKDGSPAGPRFPPYFGSLNVDGLRGWDVGQATREWAQQQKSMTK